MKAAWNRGVAEAHGAVQPWVTVRSRQGPGRCNTTVASSHPRERACVQSTWNDFIPPLEQKV